MHPFLARCVLVAAAFACTIPSRVTAQCQPHGSLTFRSPVSVSSRLSATPIFANLTVPRGIVFDTTNNLLVVERGLGITAFTEHDPSCPGWLRSLVVANASFTQGIQIDGSALYVSTSGAVLRYAYDETTRTVSGTPETVVSGIPSDGELTTRPFLLTPHKDPSQIIVSSALATNIDPTARDPSAGRSQLRAFDLLSTPANFFSGTLLAYGIRNPASFVFWPPEGAASKTLWVVENGASIDNVTGLTPAFVNDNPADELERVDMSDAGKFYGFPDCTTLWDPFADPVGDPQYENKATGDQISLNLLPERNDAWCEDLANNVAPRLSFQAHSVPLDLKFFIPPRESTNQSLPLIWAGDAFVSFHGSFDRSPPTGYAVVRVPFDATQPTAAPSSASGYEILVQAANLTSCPGTCIRPVGLAFAEDGRLFVSSDSSGEIFALSNSV